MELSTTLARSLPRIEDLGAVAVDPAAIPMAEAEFIFSGGNGVKDWDAVPPDRCRPGRHRRRVAGGGGRRLYGPRSPGRRQRHLGHRAGVRGRGDFRAIQHLQGIGACDKVVAINLDPGCDMIKRADLSVIGESAAILQALIDAVEAYRNGAKRDAA